MHNQNSSEFNNTTDEIIGDDHNNDHDESGEAEAYLGVTHLRIMELCRSKALQCHKLNRTRREFSKLQLDTYLGESCTKPKEKPLRYLNSPVGVSKKDSRAKK